jgi:hypothetical protein
MEDRDDWTGTAAELLEELEGRADERTLKSKHWAHSPRALSGRVRRTATFLRAKGIEIDFTRDPKRKRSRIITITKAGTDGALPL